MPKSHHRLGRRAFLRNGTLLLAAAGVDSIARCGARADQDRGRPAVRAGMVTDVHFADRPPGGSRFYRESLGKLGEAHDQFAKDQTDFVVSYGSPGNGFRYLKLNISNGTPHLRGDLSCFMLCACNG